MPSIGDMSSFGDIVGVSLSTNGGDAISVVFVGVLEIVGVMEACQGVARVESDIGLHPRPRMIKIIRLRNDLLFIQIRTSTNKIESIKRVCVVWPVKQSFFPIGTRTCIISLAIKSPTVPKVSLFGVARTV